MVGSGYSRRACRGVRPSYWEWVAVTGGISKPESSKPRGNTEALAAADISSPNEAFMPANGITLLDLEREHILETLRPCLGNRTHTAPSPGISDRGLRKLATYAKMGAEVPPPSPHSWCTSEAVLRHATNAPDRNS